MSEIDKLKELIRNEGVFIEELQQRLAVVMGERAASMDKLAMLQAEYKK